MSMQQQIEQILESKFDPGYLQVVNESSNHNVPAGSESHFKVTLSSAQFEGKSLIQRHRLVNSALANVLQQIHALALHTYTDAEWLDKQQGAPDSPPCLGGSKS